MDDEALIEQFELQLLPFDQWTHRTHVKVAFLYLSRHGLEEAIRRVRRGIKAYNAANNVPEGPLSGYNETTTQAFLRIIHATMIAYAKTHSVENADAFCDMHPHLLQKSVLRLFYSPERRMHPEAKTRFIEPDLAPLPSLD